MTLAIGLTGGIGSGKSTVANIFSQLNVPVFDTDIIARELVRPGKPALEKIASIFDKEIINKNGELNRQTLRQRIFDDEKCRLKLEAILHPLIREQLLPMIASCSSPYCIAVIPLLIEKNWQDIIDRVLVVDLSQELQIKRATQRDATPEDLVKKIIASQSERDQRLLITDDTIDNNGDQLALNSQVQVLHQKYLALSKSK